MRPADRLLATLDALRAAARCGDFAALGPLTARVAADLAATEAATPPPAQLAAMKASAAEVAVLLHAAERGLAAARRRLAEIERLRSGPVTYGGDGRPQNLAGTTPALRRV